MENLKECLICSTSLQDGVNNGFVLENEMTAIFLLQNILGIANSTCTEIISKRKKNSTSWFSLCQKCYNSVIETERVFKKLVNLKAKWETLKADLRFKTAKSYELQQRKIGSARSEIITDSLIETIRNESAAKRRDDSANFTSGEIEIEQDSQEEPTWSSGFDNIKIEPDSDDCEKDEDLMIENNNIRYNEPGNNFVLCKNEIDSCCLRDSSPEPGYENYSDDCDPLDDKLDHIVVAGEGETQIKMHRGPELRKRKKSLKYSNSNINFGDETFSSQEDWNPDSNSNFSPAEYDGTVKFSGKKSKTGKKKSKYQKGKFSCKFCSKVSSTPIQLQNHERRAHGVKHKFQCKFCKKILANGYTLLRHVYSVHKQKDCGEDQETEKQDDRASTSYDSSNFVKEEPTQEETEIGEFPCDICPKISTTLATKKQHERYAHNIKHEFKCDKCQKCLANGYTLLRHIQSVHKRTKKRAVRKSKVKPDPESQPGIIPERADGCSELSSGADIADDTTVDNDNFDAVPENEATIQDSEIGTFVCDFCPNISKTLLKKKIHESVAHNVKHTFQCSQCSKCLANGYTLLRHIQSVHVRKKTRAKKYRKRVEVEETAHPEGSLPATDSEQLQECGMLTDDNFGSVDVDSASGRIDLTAIQDCEIGIFTCDHCEIISSTLLKKKEHERRAHGIKHTFQCQSCQKCLANGYTLLRHFISVHIRKKSRKKKYKRNDDGMSINAQAARKVRDKYTSMKYSSGAFKCQHCGKLCATLDKKNDHENRAHGESHKFLCENCPKYFPTWYCLERHVFDMHPTTVANQESGTCNPDSKFAHVIIFRCEICGQVCKSAAKLAQHVRKIHENGVVSRRKFLCQQCGKNFPSHWDLRNHELRVHNIEVPFSCKLCKRSYTTEAKLQGHVVIFHDGNQVPVDCSECTKKFANKTMLQKHVSRVHKKDRNYSCEIGSERLLQKSIGFLYHQTK